MIEREIKKLELQNGLVPFDEWFDSLRDMRMQAAVDARLTRIRAGNFGDCKSVGGGVFELRISFGPGLRIYYGLHGQKIVVLIGGGDKRSQPRDIRRVQELWKQFTKYASEKLQDDLLKRLGDPHYAAEYLAQVLAEKDSAAFLIALKDVVEAGGGMGNLAGRVGLKRPSLYKILSKSGNPTLETLQEILEPLGLRVSVALDKAA